MSPCAHSRSRRVAVPLAGFAALLLTVIAPACSSDDEARSEPVEAADDAPPSTRTVNRQERTDLRGARYCELMLVSEGEEGFEGAVYSTMGLNECPQEQWEALDLADIAEERGALLALRNGPRHLTLDSVSIVLADEPARMTFGEIEMVEVALVNIGDELTAWPTYDERGVVRDTVFSFSRGSQIYELVNPDGTRYVMQSRSLIVDPTLSEAGLAGLGDRLMLPDGWTFEVRTLEEDLDVLDADGIATVVQDELLNTYQRIDQP